MTKDQKKLKQLEEREVFLEAQNGRLAEALDSKRDDFNLQGQMLASTTKQLNHSTETLNRLNSFAGFVEKKQADLERTRQITAEGLILERDELLVRARRLEMRIRGLGFDV